MWHAGTLDIDRFPFARSPSFEWPLVPAPGCRKCRRSKPDRACDAECEAGATELDERARKERSERREANERKQLERHEATAEMIGRRELDECVGARGEEGERGADGDEDDPREAGVVNGGECE